MAEQAGAICVFKGQEMGRRKILLVSSGGGHWVELLRISAAFEGHDTQYVSSQDIASVPNGQREPIVIPDGSRTNILGIIKIFIYMWKVERDFLPDLVVTTGAAPGLIGLIIGRLLGAKTIWLDTIASSEHPSLSGRLAQPCATLWLTQWETVARQHRRLKCFGKVV